ncbi:MAG: lipoyl(octanoyl) transferase LipB [Gluconacetobacter diazotrophicus]|nr:lipoyl(octanoyl) transferase LipB [Gluconacetobacter diazotrophicus]
MAEGSAIGAVPLADAGSDAASGLAVAWRRNAGAVPYEAALAAMREQAEGIRAGDAGEAVWLLEHPPVFTAGTSARPEDLFNPRGFPTAVAGRGGQWTYHGPGQRVAYVMLDLDREHGTLPRRDVRRFVQALEGWLIGALARLGVEAFVREGRVGVWVPEPGTGRDLKLAAIGVRVTRWVSWHGVAVNLDPALEHFDGIVPCGIRGHGVTSLRALGLDTTAAELDAALAASWPNWFGGAVPEVTPAEFTPAG